MIDIKSILTILAVLTSIGFLIGVYNVLMAGLAIKQTRLLMPCTRFDVRSIWFPRNRERLLREQRHLHPDYGEMHDPYLSQREHHDVAEMSDRNTAVFTFPNVREDRESE